MLGGPLESTCACLQSKVVLCTLPWGRWVHYVTNNSFSPSSTASLLPRWTTMSFFSGTGAPSLRSHCLVASAATADTEWLIWYS